MRAEDMRIMDQEETGITAVQRRVRRRKMPFQFRKIYEASEKLLKGRQFGTLSVDKDSQVFIDFLNKTQLAEVDLQVARDLAEARKLAEKLKTHLYLEKVIKEAKDQGEPFLARLYELDPVTRRAIIEWYNEIIKDPKKLRDSIANAPQEDVFFGTNETIIDAVIDLGNDWFIVVHVLPDGTIQLGYVANRSATAPKPLQRASDKPAEVPITVSPKEQIQKARDLFERKVDRLNEQLKDEGKRVTVTENVGNLDIVVSNIDEIGGTNASPKEYDALFDKETADSLRLIRENYRRRWEEEHRKTPADQIDQKTQGLLKDLSSDLDGKVYLRFGGETEKQTGIRWPDDVPENTYLAAQRDRKINALAEVYADYHRRKGLTAALEENDLGFTFKALHQAGPGNDVAIIDKKTGKFMWLDDYIKAGFPKNIE